MCINVLHSNLWLPAQAGERPWRSETIGVAARKMSEYFCARRHPEFGSWCVLGLLQNGYLEIDYTKWFLIFQTAQGPSEPVFSLQIGS